MFKIKKEYYNKTVINLVLINMSLAVIAVFRDIFLAAYIGTSYQADSLVLALFLPDTIGNNLLAASIGIACVPVFSRIYVSSNNIQRLYSCIKSTIFSMLLISGVLLLLFYLFGNSLLHALGSGLSEEASSLCYNLFLIILPTVMLFPLVTIGSSVLQVLNYFIIPAVAPVLFNAVILVSIVLSIIFQIPIDHGVHFVASSITGGVIVMVLLVWVFIMRFCKGAFFNLPRLFSESVRSMEWTDLKEVFTIFLPYLLIAISTQSVLLVERYLASHLGVGTIAGLNYAYRLSQFPIWVFVAAVGIVILPSMSKSRGLGNLKDLKDTFTNAFSVVLIISLPMSIVLYVLRVPIVSILLQRGAFDLSSLQITAGILAGYSLSIVGQALVYIVIRAYLALGKIGLPFLISISIAVINIVLDFYLVDRIGSAGLGFGAAAGFSLNALILVLYIKKELGISLRKKAKHILKLLCANIPVLLVTVICSKIWTAIPLESDFVVKLLYVVFVVVMLIISYFVSLRHLKIL